MTRMTYSFRFFFLGILVAACTPQDASDPLPSWHAGETRQTIVNFVREITTEGGPNFVPPAERIAVFDNDGTLWSEQPVYVQAQFAFDQVKAGAPRHPEWQDQQPFKAVLENDMASALSGGTRSLLTIILATHAGNSQEEFAVSVKTWLATARHPETGKLYTEMVYQPMLELLDYLRDNGFKTYVVSGGGVEFMRPWTEVVYGIPPEQVIGSSIRTEFALRNGVPVLARLPEMNFIDDGAGKPVGINQHIGRRPIAAFGNSDGDLQMLQWTMAGDGPRLVLLVHHTDAEREWAYDRESHVGHLDTALVEAKANGWAIADMQRDWKVIFPVNE